MATDPYGSAITLHDNDSRTLITIQRRMIERRGRMDRFLKSGTGVPHGPKHTDSPDKLDDNHFLASIGSYDIYNLGAHSEGMQSAFLMIKSNEGGDYITTDCPLSYIPGFFREGSF